jgi:hypothetical protein
VRKKRAARDPLLLEVAAAIGAGRIAMKRIRGAHGQCWPDGRVEIDPRAETVDTLVHELIHRLRPTWTERTVKARTTKLMRQMTWDEMERLYQLLLVATGGRETV